MATTSTSLSLRDRCGQSPAVPNRTGFRSPLAAYPDTIMALRWRGLHTVRHDVPGTADPDRAVRIEERSQ